MYICLLCVMKEFKELKSSSGYIIVDRVCLYFCRLVLGLREEKQDQEENQIQNEGNGKTDSTLEYKKRIQMKEKTVEVGKDSEQKTTKRWGVGEEEEGRREGRWSQLAS